MSTKVNIRKERKMKLNLGCGKDLLPGYINIDIDSNLELVRVGDVRDLSDFDDGSMEVVRATDIIEHFELDEVGNILTEWIRVLEPGGSLYIRCPRYRGNCCMLLSRSSCW